MMWNEYDSDGYQVYLLRLWRVQCEGQWEWRASIESPGTEKQKSFANLDQLYIHLCEQCERREPDATEPPGT